MKTNKMRKMNFLAILIPLIMGSCNKSQIPPKYTPPPVPPPTTVVDSLPAQYGTPFDRVPDTKDVVMYEINIRAFSSQHNLQGIIPRLDSIKALGVNVIWLMPIYPVGVLKAVPPMGSPYSVQNYRAVNPDFGTIADLKALVSDAHSKGMSVVLDWVANHTSWDNVWIVNKSWYQQDASGNIISPVGQTWNDVAALNFNNTAMRQSMINSMKYWVLAANIDGFRCDYADGPPADFWKQAIDSLHAMHTSHKLILLAESSTESLFNDGFQLNYAWNYYTSLKNVFENNQSTANLFTTNSTENSGLPGGSFKLRFTSNHDEDLDDNTPLALFNGKDGSLAAFVLAAYMGGQPLIYNGQEVGDPVQIPIFDTSTINWNANTDMFAAYKKILGFRNSSEAVKEGSIQVYTNNSDIAAFERTYGADTVLVIVNVRNVSVNYTLDASLQNSTWKDAMQNNEIVQLGANITLPAYTFRIFHQ